MDAREVDWSVYVVTDRLAAGDRSVVDIVRVAVRGGAGAVQLRDKTAPPRETLALGRALLEVTRPEDIPLIVNDRIDLALALDADGAHVGQDDLPAAEARRLLGPDRLLGVSAATVEEARAAVRDGADHLGVGDVFGTPSKPDAGAPIGTEALAAIVHAVQVPVVGIGGVSARNVAEVAATGAAGVAVISAVLRADDPEAAARALRRSFIERARVER